MDGKGLFGGDGLGGFGKPGVEGFECALADEGVALLLVANAALGGFVELLEQVEGNVGGLEILRIGVADVVDQRTEGGSAWGGDGLGAGGERGGGESGELSGGDGLDVAFDPGDLSGEEDVG